MALIIIIDDDDQVRDVLRQMLEREGYDVEDTPSGDEGIRLHRKDPADLIITDLIMPGKEGLETILDLRQDFPDVKIIAISGGGRIGPDNYLELAAGFGAVRTLAKPINMQDLLRTVKEVLAG